MTDTERLAALEDAYATGALSVRHGDWSVQYRSLREMRQVISELRARIAGASRPNSHVIRFGKGL